MPNIIIYFISVLVITTGGLIYNFAISYYILDITNSPLLFSINTVIMSIGSILALPIMDTYIDRLNRKKLIIILEALSSLSLLILIIYIYLFGFNVYFLFFITALRYLIIPVVSSTFDASLTQLFNEDKIQNILGQIGNIRKSVYLVESIIDCYIYGFFNFTNMILIFFLVVTIIACFIYIFFNFETMILIFFILQITSLILDFFLVFQSYDIPIQDKSNNFLKEILDNNKDAYNYVIDSGILWKLIVLAMVINSVGAASFSILPD